MSTALSIAERNIGHPLNDKGYPEYHDRYALALDREPHGASLAAMCAAFDVDEDTIWHWRRTIGRFSEAYKKCLNRRYKYNMSRYSDILSQVTEEGDKRLAYAPGMLEVLRKYLDDCPNRVISKHGLAVALGVSSSTIDRWRQLKVEAVADEVVNGADESFIEFWSELQQFDDKLLTHLFDKAAVGECRDAVFKAIAGRHGYGERHEHALAKDEAQRDLDEREQEEARKLAKLSLQSGEA